MITINIGPKQDPKRAIQKLKNKVIAEELFVELKRATDSLNKKKREQILLLTKEKHTYVRAMPLLHHCFVDLICCMCS